MVTSDKPDIRWACANYALGHEECLDLQGYCFMDGTTGRMIQKDIKKFDETVELRVSRGKLRDWLSIGIEIQWGKKLVSYREDEEGVMVIFDDGTRC